jgi:hypothetical protein
VKLRTELKVELKGELIIGLNDFNRYDLFIV